jgi:glycosyltransferase involved in cell wall biosynthesis
MEAEHTPLVSVIVAAYNRPDYVNQAIASVLDQTFADYEMIVVDDGSDEDAVRQYRLPSCAKLIRQAYQGRPAPGRNAGIRAAHGKYIAFLDDDDVWLPHKLSAQVKALEEHPDAGLTYCHPTDVDPSLTPLPKQRPLVLPAKDAFRQMALKCFIKSPSCVMIRRAVALECGPFDEQLTAGCDWEMWIRVALRYRLHADPECLILYRRHEGQMTRGKGTIRAGDAEVMEKTVALVQAKRPWLTILMRRRAARALRSVVRFHMSYVDDLSDTGQYLYRAWRMWPLSPSTYGLALKLRRIRREKHSAGPDTK